MLVLSLSLILLFFVFVFFFVFFFSGKVDLEVVSQNNAIRLHKIRRAKIWDFGRISVPIKKTALTLPDSTTNKAVAIQNNPPDIVEFRDILRVIHRPGVILGPWV